MEDLEIELSCCLSSVHTCPSGPQVLHLYCDTCSVPICRECTLGRHGGHSFAYLQDALQDSRALTIQLLADAQQGRQAIQVSYLSLVDSSFLVPSKGHVEGGGRQVCFLGSWTGDQKDLGY